MKKLIRLIKRDPYVFISIVIIFCLLALFVAYPVFSAFKLSVTKNGHWTLQSYAFIFKKAWLRRSFLHSLLLGTITASISVVIGYLFSFLTTRTKVTGRNFLRLMATLPIISPPFMLTLSVILLLGRNGFITHQLLGLKDFDVYGLSGLVFVQSICMFPIAYLTISSVLQRIDSSIEDAALDLGASPLKTFFSVTLPLSAPGVVASWLLVFVTSLADFANPMILAGKYDVLSVQAYLQFTGMGNLELGAALSNLLLVPCLTAYFLQRTYLKNRSFVTVTGKPQLRTRDLCPKPLKIFLSALAYFICFVIILLYVTVLAGCFTKSWGLDYRFSLENFAYVFDVGWQTIRSTVFMSSVATPIAGVLGVIIAFLLIRKKFPGKKIL